MTVAIADNRVQYTADGSQVDFPYTFRILQAEDLIVATTDQFGTIVTVDPGEYTVSGVDDDDGGNVEFTVPPTNGLIVTLYRAVPVDQLTDYVPYDPFPAETHERALDKLTMICQQLQEQVDRAFLLPPDDPGGSQLIVELVEPYANTVLTFDTTGTVLTNSTEIGDWGGEWQAGKSYRARQFVADITYSDMYVVIQDHVSTDLADDVAAGNIVRILKWYESNAWKWAQQNEDVQVNDDTNPVGFSAYHWAQKAEQYTSEALPRVRWLNLWQPIEYVFSDMVFEDGWLMIANTTTQDHAAPQPIGSLTWAYPELPLFVDATHAGTVYCGSKIDAVSNASLVTGIRLWLPDVSPTVEYRVAIRDNITEELTITQTFNGDILGAPGWYEATVNPFWINQGDDVSVVMVIQNVTATTSFNHPWTYKRVQGATPNAGEINRDSVFTKVQINKTDNDAVDQSTDLALVGIGTTLTVADALDATSYVSFNVSKATDNGTYYEYDITYIETGAGGEPAADTVCTCTFQQPTLGTVTYPTLANFHATNAAEGVLKLDDGAPVYSDTGYGVDLLFQQYIFSPDWDIASYMGSGGSSSGGGGGDATVLVQETKPDEATQFEGTLWFRSSTADMFCLFEDSDSKQWVKIGCSVGENITPENYPQVYVGDYKNKIINGDMSVWQRGDTFTGGALRYTADRWRVSTAADVVQSVAYNNPERPFRMALTANGTAQAYVSQNIENASQFAGRVVTFSFDMFAREVPANGLVVAGFGMNFGTGGSATLNYYPSVPFKGINEWHRYSFTVTLGGDSGETYASNSSLLVSVYPFSSVGGQIGDVTYLGNLQLEYGYQATAFERRHIQQELAMCHRYYFDNLGADANTGFGSRVNSPGFNTHRVSFRWPVEMRGTPTISNITNSAGADPTLVFADAHGIGRIDFASAETQINLTLSASAEF